jgi:hypothetical protein
VRNESNVKGFLAWRQVQSLAFRSLLRRYGALQALGSIILAGRSGRGTLWNYTGTDEYGPKIMSTLQTPKHKAARSFLRVAGPILAAAGLIFFIIGLASFFSAFGGNGPPRLFWCCFVGMPLLFVGGVMCLFGFMGAVARYSAAEQVPVATDAINDLAVGTKGAVKTVARAVTEGVDEARKTKN